MMQGSRSTSSQPRTQYDAGLPLNIQPAEGLWAVVASALDGRLMLYTRATPEPQLVQRQKNASPGFQAGLQGPFSAVIHGWGGWGRGVGLQPATSLSARLELWGSPTNFYSAAPPSDWGYFME
jgi:hypothetical protein